MKGKYLVSYLYTGSDLFSSWLVQRVQVVVKLVRDSSRLISAWYLSPGLGRFRWDILALLSQRSGALTGTNYSDITSVVTFYRTNPGHRLNKYSESWLQVLTKHQTVSLCSLFLSRCIHSDLWQFLTIRALFLLLLVSANGDDTVKLSSIITTFTRRKGANGVHEIVVDCWFSG